MLFSGIIHAPPPSLPRLLIRKKSTEIILSYEALHMCISETCRLTVYICRKGRKGRKEGK